jgi:DNA-binding PadR family transcriptional regulator
MADQELKGHLDLLVLAVLGEGPAHGYLVIEGLRRRSGGTFDLPEGTVYPALHRLEKTGLLTSEWSVVGGRRRRTYSLTDEGQAALQVKQNRWDEFAAAVQRVIGGTPWPATS